MYGYSVEVRYVWLFVRKFSFCSLNKIENLLEIEFVSFYSPTITFKWFAVLF